jgi:hypothetical protein
MGMGGAAGWVAARSELQAVVARVGESQVGKAS